MEQVPAGGSVVAFGDKGVTFLECKVDGCVNRRAGKAGVGGHYGDISFEHSIPEFCIDSTYAELFALSLALQVIPPEHQFVRIGLDSFQALEHLMKGTERYASLLQSIRSQVAFRQGVVFQNIPNASNKIADNLSRKAAGLTPR